MSRPPTPRTPRTPRKRPELISRIWPAFLVLLVASYFLLLYYFPGNDGESRDRGKRAYATLLCDEKMADASAVMVRSLRLTGTAYDIVVLAMPNVSESTAGLLEMLGAQVRRVENPVPYPFEARPSRVVQNKPCRYSQLLVWGLTQYKKVVYLDSDILVLENVDDLFNRPELSAAPDTFPPDSFNSGVLVLRPSQATLKSMLAQVNTTASSNVGPQGFLNVYFSSWYNKSASHHLAVGDNALVKMSDMPQWETWVVPTLRVLHFSGDVKPWNFRSLDARAAPPGSTPLAGRRQAPRLSNSGSLRSRYDKNWWQALGEVQAHVGSLPGGPAALPRPACQLSQRAQGKYLAYRFSVVLDARHLDAHDELVLYMLRFYGSMRLVHKIYVLPRTTAVAPTYDAAALGVRKPVEVLPVGAGAGAGSERAHAGLLEPIAGLQTECVLVARASVEMPEASINAAFRKWTADKWRLVGFYPEAHFRDGSTGRLVHVGAPKLEFSMVHSKMVMLHTRHLRAFSCQMPQVAQQYVDRHPECTDAFFNTMASHLSGTPPVILLDPNRRDYDDDEELRGALPPPPAGANASSVATSAGAAGVTKSACLDAAERLIGDRPLQNTSEVITFFPGDSSVPRQYRAAGAARAEVPPERLLRMFDADSAHTNIRDPQLHFLPTVESSVWNPEVAVVPSATASGSGLLCVLGNDTTDDGSSRNKYFLVELADVPRRAVKYPGTTYMLASRWDFQQLMAVHDLIGTMFAYQEEFGAGFQPSRVLFYRMGGLVTTLGPSTLALVHALFGRNAAPLAIVPQTRPHCFEKVVLIRRHTVPLASKVGILPAIRSRVWSYCDDKWHRPLLAARASMVSVAEEGRGRGGGAGGGEGRAMTRDRHRLLVLVVAHKGRHVRGRLDNEKEVLEAIDGSICRPTGKCRVALVYYNANLDFCTQVQQMRDAAILIGAHGEGLYFLAQLLPPQALVVEVVGVDKGRPLLLKEFSVSARAAALHLAHTIFYQPQAGDLEKTTRGTLPPLEVETSGFVVMVQRSLQSLLKAAGIS
eukprot:jgi/Mesen1/10721/ME000090S10179